MGSNKKPRGLGTGFPMADQGAGSRVEGGAQLPSPDADEVLKILGGAELLRRQAKQFAKDGEFVRRHFHELAKQYRDRWIAVYEGKLVAADDELEGLVSKLRLARLPLSQVVVEHMTQKRVPRVL